MNPVLFGSNRRMLNAVVVFPAPVSPTSPSVSPFLSVKLIPLTAYIVSSSVS